MKLLDNSSLTFVDSEYDTACWTQVCSRSLDASYLPTIDKSFVVFRKKVLAVAQKISCSKNSQENVYR